MLDFLGKSRPTSSRLLGGSARALEHALRAQRTAETDDGDNRERERERVLNLIEAFGLARFR